MRQIVLDTETTGLSTAQGHRIIEIGCIELRQPASDRPRVSSLPESGSRYRREVPSACTASAAQTSRPQPRFPEIVDELLDFLRDAELVIHNAAFDVGFLDHELTLMKHAEPKIESHATVLDTLTLARELHPGQRNSLDALCKRYEVDASKRDVHGALIDAELLAHVYLAMTGGQSSLLLDEEESGANATNGGTESPVVHAPATPAAANLNLKVIAASAEEVAAHEAMLKKIRKSGACVWDFD